jgi:hypothetical protein
MSSEEPVRPYHAKQDAKGEEAADAVAAVLKHAKDRDKAAEQKAPRKKQPKWMLPLGINLAVFAVYLLIAPPAWVTMNPVEPPDMAAQEQSLRVAMYLQAQQVEAFRLENEVLPTTLDELARDPLAELEYVRDGSSFQLIGTVGEQALVYDSASPDPAFASSVADRMAGAGG